jgi:hypothetical protein
VPVNAEITFLLFKERRPFKLKKEYPSEQWQIISFRLIPLKTPVSFRWTVPLDENPARYRTVSAIRPHRISDRISGTSGFQISGISGQLRSTLGFFYTHCQLISEAWVIFNRALKMYRTGTFDYNKQKFAAPLQHVMLILPLKPCDFLVLPNS